MSEPWPGRAAAPSLDDIARLAEEAFAALPDLFRRMAGDIVFRVDDFPDEEVLAALEIEDPFGLTGLYQGVDLARRSVLDLTAEDAGEAEDAPSRAASYQLLAAQQRARPQGDCGLSGRRGTHQAPENNSPSGFVCGSSGEEVVGSM